MTKKFEKEREAYQDKIKLLKAQMEELDILKLQNEEAYIKLEALYKWGIIDANFEAATDMK